ncbi:GFA family protein [Erythrobacter sp. JK5]|uniref:GFA family protein n=1 Tax=Erythrobacter sp. JK5 TaxID=2829500 RepID=UPI001BA4DA76|nr:GFA family protein [Erythrobacter sp. JK5]QUL38077.1 GFA family protein [Erythrobacter sp. JK5]
MTGGCHCGAVTVTLSRRPEYVNLCDCSLCAKSGGAWGYFCSAEVSVEGETANYRRADYEKPAVEMHFCRTCGTTTHWTLTEYHDGDRVGVNMRIFEPSELSGIEARTLDGRNWFGETAAAYRRPVGCLGSDVFL